MKNVPNEKDTTSDHGKESVAMGLMSDGGLTMTHSTHRRMRRGWWRCGFGRILNKSGLDPRSPTHRGTGGSHFALGGIR